MSMKLICPRMAISGLVGKMFQSDDDFVLHRFQDGFSERITGGEPGGPPPVNPQAGSRPPAVVVIRGSSPVVPIGRQGVKIPCQALRPMPFRDSSREWLQRTTASAFARF